MARYVSIQHDSGLAKVRIDRPPANALDVQLIEEIAQAASVLSGPETRVVLLTSGQPMFMAGADLIHMVDKGWDHVAAMVGHFQAAVNAWEQIPGATIAVINGHALGGGCELALACDWRLMARGRARIGLPEGLRGLMPAGGGTQRMVRLLGKARAMDLCIRGRLLTADEAESVGLVSEAVDPGDLDQRAHDLAEELLKIPHLSLRAIKHSILIGADGPLERGLAIEGAEMSALGNSADAREGVRAFLEKREPRFVHQ